MGASEVEFVPVTEFEPVSPKISMIGPRLSRPISLGDALPLHHPTGYVTGSPIETYLFDRLI